MYSHLLKMQERLAERLYLTGFRDSAKAFNLPLIVKEQGSDKSIYRYSGHETDYPELRFDFNIHNRHGEFHILSVDISKNYTLKGSPEKQEVFTKTLTSQSRLFDRQEMIDYFLASMKQATIKDELYFNPNLRRMISERGYDYDRMVKGAEEVVSNMDEWKGKSLIQEKIPLDDNLGLLAESLVIQIQFRRIRDYDHRIEEVGAWISSGRTVIDHSKGVPPQANRTNIIVDFAKNGIPWRDQLINRVIASERVKIANVRRAYQALHDIQHSPHFPGKPKRKL